MLKKLEEKLFQKHPFCGTFGIALILGLPWWIAFWPGTLQYDSCGQLLQYIGVGRMTGHHPYPVTMIMGILLDIGKWGFDSDNVGIFLYTMLQFLAQSCVIAYAFCVFERFQTPYWVRWGTLIFYTIFPLLPNWGISYGKDTGYYISFLLLILVMWDVFGKNEERITWQQLLLWLTALLGIVIFRNDGRYVAIAAILGLLWLRRQYWKSYVLGGITIVAFLVLVEGIYMPLRNIPGGSVREAISVPLMQTAVYIRDYSEEITDEEKSTLLDVFEVTELEAVAAAYDRNISDAVKALFKEYPDRNELLAYFRVWWKQFLKAPVSYVSTYLEHCSGYFLLHEKCYNDIIGWFKILDGDSRSDEYLDIYFAGKDTAFRELLEKWAYAIYDIPVVGWLFRTSLHTWILCGSAIWLLCRKRISELYLVIPAFMVLLICTVSPLNASVRYFLPVMATTPVYIAVCTSGKK